MIKFNEQTGEIKVTNSTSSQTLKENHIVDTNEMVSYTKQDVIDSINRMYDIFMDDTLEAKKLRLKGVSWHIQNILESIKSKTKLK